MWNDLINNDPSGQILSAWIAKEELRKLLALAKTGGNRHDAAHQLFRFKTWCANAHIPELERLAKTIEAWWPEVLGFLQTDITNAATEATNRTVKTAARTAYGFRNLDTNAAEYGSPAPGHTAGQPTAEGYFPLNFEEPASQRSTSARTLGGNSLDPVDRGAFADTRAALHLVRLLSTLEQQRHVSPELDALLTQEERRNGFLSEVRLMNQAAFLQFAYMTLVRTREAYFRDPTAIQLLERETVDFVEKVRFAGDRQRSGTGVELVRWLRNALAHSRVEVTELNFVFYDRGGRPCTTVEMTMSWTVLGQLCEAVVRAGNRFLYPEVATHLGAGNNVER